jgi:branched-subunit amino acid transport protein
MSWSDIVLVGGMALVTFACRYPVLAFVSRLTIPPRVRATMEFIPTAVLTAIITPAILAPNGELALHWQNPALIAALLCGLVAWRSQNILLTIVVGMATWWVWRWLV